CCAKALHCRSSVRCCATAASTPPPFTPRSTSDCCTRWCGRGRERHHADRCTRHLFGGAASGRVRFGRRWAQPSQLCPVCERARGRARRRLDCDCLGREWEIRTTTRQSLEDGHSLRSVCSCGRYPP